MTTPRYPNIAKAMIQQAFCQTTKCQNSSQGLDLSQCMIEHLNFNFAAASGTVVFLRRYQAAFFAILYLLLLRSPDQQLKLVRRVRFPNTPRVASPWVTHGIDENFTFGLWKIYVRHQKFTSVIIRAKTSAVERRRVSAGIPGLFGLRDHLAQRWDRILTRRSAMCVRLPTRCANKLFRCDAEELPLSTSTKTSDEVPHGIFSRNSREL